MDNQDIFNATKEIPDWQISLVKKRIQDYIKNPDQVLDFDETMDEIENEL